MLLSNKSFTHWGRVTHICVSKLTIIGLDNGFVPGQRQVIIWTNAGILLIGILGTNFNEILGEIHTFSFKKMHLKMSSGKCQPFCFPITSPHWFRWWLGAIKHQAITLMNVDPNLCCHMASLGHNELICLFRSYHFSSSSFNHTTNCLALCWVYLKTKNN